MSTPKWSPVDDATGDLLSLVADDPHPSNEMEWQEFLTALEYAAMKGGGVVNPNTLRPLVRGLIAPKRLGAFTRRALAQGLMAWRGEWQISDDIAGHNGGRPMRVYVYLGGA
jgi:hypothetical protein